MSPIGSQGVLAGFSGWDKAISRRGWLEVGDLCDPLETGKEGHGKWQHVFCNRTVI